MRNLSRAVKQLENRYLCDNQDVHIQWILLHKPLLELTKSVQMSLFTMLMQCNRLHLAIAQACHLRWLKTVSSTFQDLDFDVSL